MGKGICLFGRKDDSQGWIFTGHKEEGDTHTLFIDDMAPIPIPPKLPCQHKFKTFVSSPEKGFEYALCFDCHAKLVPTNWENIGHGL